MVNWSAKRSKAGRKLGRQGLRTMGTPSAKNIALLAYRGVKGLRALINSETHFRNVTLSQALVANTAVITQLNDIVQGDTLNSRTGNSCLMSGVKSIEFITSAVDNCIVREMLILDKQQIQDTAPAILDILQTQSPTSMFSQEFSQGRFQILEDNLYVLDTSHNSSRIRRKYKSLKGKHAYFNGTASTDINKNGVYKIWLSDAVATIQCNYRLGFHDN